MRLDAERLHRVRGEGHTVQGSCGWLIDEFHAKPIRGEKPEKLETAALADEEILELIHAVEARWGEGWRNVLITLVGLGIRPFELTKIEAPAPTAKGCSRCSRPTGRLAAREDQTALA